MPTTRKGIKYRNGLKFAIIFTTMYLTIGIVGISIVDLVIDKYQEWIFLLITTVIMFCISLRFIYAAREQIRLLVEQQFELKIYKNIFDQMREGLVITNDREEILNINPSFTAMTGYNGDEILGKTPSILKSGVHSKEFYSNMKKELKTNGQWDGEIINQRKNGEIFPEKLSITAIRNPQGGTTNYIGIFTDITQQRKAEGKIEFLKHYDTNTRLPKFKLFVKHLSNFIVDQGVENKKFSLFIIDTARLKTLNATYGYKVVDELLQTLAIRLQARYRGFMLGRLNSKEFAIVLPYLYEKQEINNEAESLLQEIEAPIQYEGEEYFLSATIGIGIYPQHGLTADELYKNATLAKTVAKDIGYQYQLFDNHLLSKVKRKVLLEKHLIKAIELNELQIYYQPQIDIKNNRVVGFEALIRWHHPSLGIISPAEFIPLAEESGLIISIGEWVLETVCYQINSWHKEGVYIPKISINLSPKQFQNLHLFKRTEAIIHTAHINPALIEFEITENISLYLSDSIINTIYNFKKLGIKISIDDFGKGHSSLTYLQKLPIDHIKIDRAFILDIPHNKNNIILTKAIIAMAHELNISVIAEGVENKEQLQFLVDQQCDFIQGYYFGKPLPAGDIFNQILKLNTEYEVVL